MLARSHRINARLTALEAYVAMPKEHTGMTLTSRLEAQHSLLLALRADQSETTRRLSNVEDRLTNVEGRLTSVEGRLTNVEGRLTGIEDVMGKMLWGMTEIKNLLTPQADPP
jgi:chromosome segregation ATPase